MDCLRTCIQTVLLIVGNTLLNTSTVGQMPLFVQISLIIGYFANINQTEILETPVCNKSIQRSVN